MTRLLKMCKLVDLDKFDLENWNKPVILFLSLFLFVFLFFPPRLSLLFLLFSKAFFFPKKLSYNIFAQKIKSWNARLHLALGTKNEFTFVLWPFDFLKVQSQQPIDHET